MKRLTPYQILEKVTSQTKKEWYEVCPKKGLMMKSQQLYQVIHNNVRREQPMFIRALQGHSGETLDISTSAHKKIQTGYASLLYHIGFSRYKDSLQKKWNLCQEVLEQAKAENIMYFSFASPLVPEDSERSTWTRGTSGFKNESKMETSVSRRCLQRRTAQMLERSQSLLQYYNNIASLQDWYSTDHGSHTPLQDEGEGAAD